LFLLRLWRGISRTFLLGDRLLRFLCIAGDARLQLRGIDLFGARPEEAAFIERYRMLQIPPDGFQFLDLSLQSLGLILEGVRLILEGLGSASQGLRLILERLRMPAQMGQGLAQPLVLLLQGFSPRGSTHRQSLWRACALSG